MKSIASLHYQHAASLSSTRPDLVNMEGTTDRFPKNGNHTQEGRRAGGDRAARISDQTWETHKQIIYKLWIEQDLVLDEVLTQLMQTYQFSPREVSTQHIVVFGNFEEISVLTAVTVQFTAIQGPSVCLGMAQK